jgi:hypothetical protein
MLWRKENSCALLGIKLYYPVLKVKHRGTYSFAARVEVSEQFRLLLQDKIYDLYRSTNKSRL